ncbi:MAG: glycosyltransferase family 4 protein [Flavobacteriales bacterium]|nr:glycosyltransferase family 4 protein [Flavobacteriales bacterium]MDW8409063.1 glycosyltransferase family 4 protein [Flavobacteriales bacterium]
MNVGRAVLITYYWPPASGPGVHRWLRFSRHWPHERWPLTVFVPERAAYIETDPTLCKLVPDAVKVHKVPIVEPAQFISNKPGVAFAGEKGTGFRHAVMAWIRGNFFIPDARVFWVKPLVRHVHRELKGSSPLMLITTGPPHSVHLAGLQVKRRLPEIFWIADFRDPWMEVDYLHHLRLTSWARWIHARLERSVLQGADVVTTVSPGLQRLLKAKTTCPVVVVPNGFDPTLLPPAQPKSNPSEFSILHTGTLPAERNVPELWEALQRLQFPFTVHLVGQVDTSIRQSIQAYGLQGKVHVLPPVPHAEALQRQRQAALLLVVANRTDTSQGILTGKVFEYLASGRPIIAFGPMEGDLCHLIQELKAGWYIPFGRPDIARQVLEEAYHSFCEGRLLSRPPHLGPYDSRKLALEFEKLFYQKNKHNYQ